METQDRGLYTYFRHLADKVIEGTYEASETELIVCEKYIGNYLETRLSNCFILEVCKPVMELVDFFESSKVRIQHKHGKLSLLLHDFLSKLMKNAGLEGEMSSNNVVAGKDLLKVKFTDRKKQLSNKDLWLGKRVDELLIELKLNVSSEEIQDWLGKVRHFYEVVVRKIVQVFSPAIKSRMLQAAAVISPSAWSTTDLDTLKKSWKQLGSRFPNVISVEMLPDLLTEVVALKFVRPEEGMDEEPDAFLAELSKIKDDDDDSLIYPLLSGLGSAICTLYNSSSAERDFSIMNFFVGEPSKNRTSPLFLNAKMHIKAELMSLSRKCMKCKVLKEKEKKGAHCHCSVTGDPYKRYKKDMEEKAKSVLRSLALDEDCIKKKDDLKEEVVRLRRRVMDAKKKSIMPTKKVSKVRRRNTSSTYLC